jgi:hypothetical protein
MVSGVMADTKYRDFTSAEGKTIRGRIQAYDARTKTVTIERDNRRTSKVQLTVFSEADQTYILEWDSAKGFLSCSLLKISCDDKVVENRKEKEIADVRYTGGEIVKDFEKTVTTFERIAFEIEFQNRNKSELKGIRMQYQIYYEQSKMAWDKKPKVVQKHVSKKMDIPTLQEQSKIMVTTESVEIHEDSINEVPSYRGDLRQGGKGDVHGMRARIYMKMPSGKEVMREVTYPQNLSEKRFPWKN